MKRSSWLLLAAVAFFVIVAVAYSSGYQLGADIAERENTASEAQ